MDRSAPFPAELLALFETYSTNGVMDVTQFLKFLKEVQKEQHATESDAKGLMEAVLHVPGLPESSPLTFSKQKFVDYIFDICSNLAINTRMHHNMNCPISHYFIFTGHNSYLTGNQLSSACSEKPIVEALRRGVRVVELDLWPNSEKDEILVLHGRTLTSPVDFKKCLTAIKENAFVKSQYPVIVTLEDHLPSELQAKAAKTIVDTFGTDLFYPENVEELKEFPSPESLKGRILISTKPPKEYLEVDNTETSKNFELNIVHEEAEESSDEENKPPEQREGTFVSPEYKKIITIRAGKPKGKSLTNVLKVTEAYPKRVSLSESQFAKVAAAHPHEIVEFTKRNFLRIYPYGLRLDSSNYNPIQAWSHGAQMVAINMQGYGKHLWLAQGFFKANGGCGYVKKPTFLLPEGSETCVTVFEPIHPMPVKQILKVKVLMGHGWLEQFGKNGFDKFSLPDFYTRVGIAGVKADTLMKKTTTINNNWVPQWEEKFEFHLTVPELALLRIEVLENNTAGRDDFAGQMCLPVSELKPGYRALPLCDEKGEIYRKGNDLGLVRLLLHLELLSGPF